MNKKGNIYFGIIIAILIWFFGILFLPFILDDITTARNNLQCSSDSISYGTMGLCLLISSLTPYVIWTIASIALGYIAGSFR